MELWDQPAMRPDAGFLGPSRAGPAARGGALDICDWHPTAERKPLLLRLAPNVHEALARWAADELRSLNGQIEFLLREALRQAGRLPSAAPRPRRPSET